MVDTVLVKNANRMMMVASLLEDGIELSFADGCDLPPRVVPLAMLVPRRSDPAFCLSRSVG